jgi:hypothetical protein
MTSEEKILKNKVGLVKLAQTLGNVSRRTNRSVREFMPQERDEEQESRYDRHTPCR